MLNIYRASAGAGKTHHLTGEYIKLLFRKDYLPEDADHETRFNEILAVTFTNKSTAEMKTRIVQELSNLANEPRKSHYYKDVCIDGVGGTLSDQQIQEKARKFLNDILNNYSDFSVSTIDSFFQKIIRSFAREMNMQSNYEVELNADRVLEMAVSAFMEKLSRPKHKKLFDWMLKFSEKKIEEGGGWRLEKDLLKLVKSVMVKEEYRMRSESIKKVTADKEWLGNYTRKMQDIVSDTIKQLRAIGQEGIEVLGEAGFQTTDFSGSSRSKMTIFDKWQRGEVVEPDEKLLAWTESDANWYARAATRFLPEVQTQRILQLFQKVVGMQNQGEFRNYYTAKVILDNIYQLGILADIDKEVNEICNDEGTMLLSSTTEMLNKLISVDDAPFIYEKTGSHIHNYMIDEFQDTSHMQWNNFRPLIENALAEGRSNLIVGDVKQSIYRWRGSDWGLLHSELKEFAPKQSHEDKDTLNTNYRSQKEIIRFNKDFFSYAAERLAAAFNDPDIAEIYSDVSQEVPQEKEDDAPGAVKVNFIEVAKDEKFEDKAMKRLPEAIMQLQDAGFNAKDIAVLCRTGKQCKLVADTLLKYKSEHREDEKYVFDIISNEALKIGSRKVICTIISILRYIQNPESRMLQTIATCNILQQQGMTENEAVSQCFRLRSCASDFLQFANRPLYDMLEGIIALLPSVDKDIAYVQAFRDCVLEFTNNKKCDVAAFLEWWEQNGDGRCINTPQSQNAIQIMTIHKSKGLGMPAVILPFVAGTTDMENKGGEILWCKPEEAPFAEENLVLPVKRTKMLEKTVFAKDYEEERLRAVIDNLNTLYVAFTRAKEAMVIFSPLPADNDKQGNSQECLLKTFFEMRQGEASGNEYMIGEFLRNNDYWKKVKEAKEPGIEKSEEDYDYETLRKLPRLSLKRNRLVKDIEAIERGNCIHQALSAIINYDEIDAPIDMLYATGQLTEEYFTCAEMKAELHRLLSQEEVRVWFKPELTVLNERTILGERTMRDGSKKNMHRPDRVVIDGTKAIVIDYKTGEHRKAHAAQVGDYMALLRSMGFQEVEGYIWYTSPHQIEKVR